MKKDTQYFKDLLVTESIELEKQLETLGRKNPDQESDWETVRKENTVDAADEGEVADGIEEYENNNAILGQLEIKLRDVKSALTKIDEGKYGICDVCGNEIEDDRLEANTSASTCKLHM